MVPRFARLYRFTQTNRLPRPAAIFLRATSELHRLGPHPKNSYTSCFFCSFDDRDKRRSPACGSSRNAGLQSEGRPSGDWNLTYCLTFSKEKEGRFLPLAQDLSLHQSGKVFVGA